MSIQVAKASAKKPPAAAEPNRQPGASAASGSRRETLARSAADTPSAGRMSALLSPRVQTSLQVSSPADAAEREAEATAKKVTRMSPPTGSVNARADGGGLSSGLLRQPDRVFAARAQLSALLPRSGTIARVPRSSAAPAAAIQRKADGVPTVTPDVADAIHGSLGSGMPLPPAVRGFMEPRFRADFGRVRVHTGDKPARLAQRLSAKAFTVGGNIFFGKGQFRPGSEDGKELIAHELTHTVQQGATVQRSEDRSITESAPVQVQRLGAPNPLDYFADKANLIPGFRMFTIILGMNPINLSRVDRSAANILRALIEFLPGGGLITQALENSGVFEKVGNWVAQQIQTLGLVGSAIKQAVTDFVKSLNLSDVFDLGGVWARAKRIFTEPIDRIISFAKGLITGIIQFIKDAILKPLAKLAEGTAGYALLKAVLGKDPITDEKVPDDAAALRGSLMTVAGQDEIWGNVKKANAIGRISAWFKGAKAGLIAFVAQIPALAIAAFKSLELADIVLVPRALIKVAAVFGGFLGKFIGWVGTAVWNLLEIVFDVVSPGAFGYVKKTGAALKSILKNPLPFVGNLVKAAKLGFTNFAGRFLNHLKAGLIDWLTGSLVGVYIPKALSLPELGKLALSVLGISWAQIRGKIVKALGPSGETIMKGLEVAFDVVKALVTGGPAAAWEVIKQKLTDLKDAVVDGIIGFIKDAVVTKAIPKLIAMFIPGAGFISAILSIYDTVMVFVAKISKIIQVVTAFINSIVAIAAGNIGAAAAKVESILAGLLALAINFLAGFAGLGKIADKIKGVIDKVRDKIDKALDAAVAWIVGRAKALFAKLFGKQEKGNDKAGTLTPAQAVAEVKKRANAAGAQLARRKNADVGGTMKAFYDTQSKWVEQSVISEGGKKPRLLVVPQHDEGSYWLEIKINPVEITTKWPRGTGGQETRYGKRYIGMFHGSLVKITSLPEIDMSKLTGGGGGAGLELGSGLYLTHYFSDVKGYAPRPAGWVHRILVPEEILSSATMAKPDTSGDKSWEGQGEVLKGTWLHIGGQGWKAGFQWCIKSEKIIKEKLTLDAALPVLEAADKWGRGRMNEFPDLRSRKLTGAGESQESGRQLAAAGSARNPYELGGYQVAGESKKR